jgi:hypothetical protein
MSRPRRRAAPHPALDDDDPLSGMVNLFDIAIVFAVGLMVALAAAMRGGQLSSGTAPPEIEVKEGHEVVRYRASQDTAKGTGKQVGAAYRLPSGEVVYVPDEPDPASPAR